MKYIIVILTSLLLGSCVEKVSSPFKPSLKLVITELIDSLKNEIGENKLLSIQFFSPDSHTDYRNRQGGEISICLLDGYASGNMDGYAKIGTTTIAIYNLKDDIFELVNKNEITFFTDTILGFKDICFLDLTGKKQLFYKITSEESITRVSYSMDFLYLKALRILPRCRGDISWTPSEKIWFHDDSLRVEENLKYYQKEVEYYRNKRSE